MPEHYHYIITGAGLAGSSLLLRMIREPFFKDKKILVIDQSIKQTNDRTWCFWEKESGLFEPIVHHQWDKINFYSNSFSATLPINPYQYKMIRGIDLYTYVRNEAEKHPNIEWRYGKINAIRNKEDKAVVETEVTVFTADFVFNSILFNNNITSSFADAEALVKESGGRGIYSLLQHFKGWVIETAKPSFDATTATMMDFRVSQNMGTTFMYVMPITPTKALVEYTLFTKELLPENVYDEAIRKYIADTLKVSDYTKEHTEFGVIPMTNQQFPLQDGRIIYMGIAGGQAKGSSGYAFQFIQKRTAQIVNALLDKGDPFIQKTFNDKKFHLYDSVLLNVLENRKMNGDEIFASIFKKNPAQRILKFLDNESTLWEDLQIMQSVPTGIFLPAAMHELIG